MRVIEFDGDPMLKLEGFDDLSKYSFYLNQASVDEIKSYSEEVKENVPEFFNDIDTDYVLFVEGGIDDDGNEFPDTYIGIKNNNDSECEYKMAGIYASDIQYKNPTDGEKIYLKKNDVKMI